MQEGSLENTRTLKTHEIRSGEKGGGHPAVYSKEDIGFLVQVCTTMRRTKTNRPPIWGYLMRTPSLFHLGYTVPHSIPSPSNQRPINVEYFQAQHRSRANQRRAFTSDSIIALVTP